jgi:uncharacterized cupin superfamily protein
MTRLNQRILDSRQFNRRKANADTQRKIAGWEIWECDGPKYQYSYDRRVSLFVHHGKAQLNFDNGDTVDLIPGDFLTIEPGASAIWVISEPIRNSYVYHDSFESASVRAEQVHWRNK